MVHQHVNHILEAVWIFGRKEATADLIYSLPQLRQALVEFSGIVPRGDERTEHRKPQKQPQRRWEQAMLDIASTLRQLLLVAKSVSY